MLVGSIMSFIVCEENVDTYCVDLFKVYFCNYINRCEGMCLSICIIWIHRVCRHFRWWTNYCLLQKYINIAFILLSRSFEIEAWNELTNWRIFLGVLRLLACNVIIANWCPVACKRKQNWRYRRHWSVLLSYITMNHGHWRKNRRAFGVFERKAVNYKTASGCVAWITICTSVCILVWIFSGVFDTAGCVGLVMLPVCRKNNNQSKYSAENNGIQPNDLFAQLAFGQTPNGIRPNWCLAKWRSTKWPGTVKLLAGLLVGSI